MIINDIIEGCKRQNIDYSVVDGFDVPIDKVKVVNVPRGSEVVMASDGFPQGINDVGFVKLPDGRHYAIAVFIESSCCDMDGTERMIADISSIVLKFMQGK